MRKAKLHYKNLEPQERDIFTCCNQVRMIYLVKLNNNKLWEIFVYCSWKTYVFIWLLYENRIELFSRKVNEAMYPID